MRARIVDLDRWRSTEGRSSLRRLTEMFQRNGYVRSAPDRSADESTHRGYELRFSASTEHERDEVVTLLRKVGIDAGKPFEKGPSWRIPVYGKHACDLLAAAFKLGKGGRRPAAAAKKAPAKKASKKVAKAPAKAARKSAKKPARKARPAHARKR